MLQYKVENIDDLDESHRGLYEQSDDGYVLKVAGIPQASEDLSGLKNKVQQLMDEAKAAKAKAREIEQQKAEQLSLIHISEPTRPY